MPCWVGAVHSGKVISHGLSSFSEADNLVTQVVVLGVLIYLFLVEPKPTRAWDGTCSNSGV